MSRRPHGLRVISLRVVTAIAAALVAGCTVTGTPAPEPTDTATAPPPAQGGVAAVMPGIPLWPVPVTVAAGVDAGSAEGQSLNLPEGWTAEVWAAVPDARMAAWTPDGRLIVSTGDRGRLALLTPGAAGEAATVTTLLEGLDNPQGVAVAPDAGRTVLVVGEQPRIVVYDYADGRVSNRRVLVDGLPGGGHGSKAVAVHDGVVAYNIGSASNRDPSDRSATPPRATVQEIRLDGTGARTLAVGVRNGFGLSFAPDGSLFAAINQADNQPYPFRDDTGEYGQSVADYINEHPNDQISRIAPGTDMGWPYCVPDSRGRDDLRDLGYVNDPATNPDGQALDCAGIGRTQLGLPAHSAPLGLTFTHGSELPAAYSHGALVTAHGSWNRQPPREPYVAYIPWDDATGTLLAAQVLVTGFQAEDGSRWGRSVVAVPGPDGSLYITDDAAGLIYRVSPPQD